MTRNLFSNSLYVGLAFLAALFVIPHIADSAYVFHIFILICVFGALSTAWNIVGGFAGQLSLGHAVYYGIGSYVGVLCLIRFGLSPWIGMFIGAALASLVSVLISWPTLRLRGPFFTLASIAILEVVRLLVIHEAGLTGGSSGLSIPLKLGFKWMVFQEKSSSFNLAFVFLLSTLAVAYAIRNSKFGFSLFAVREREDAARAVGINVVRVRILASVVSAALTSAIGTFYAVYLTYIDPEATFSLGLSIQIAMFALIGGLGTVFGPLIGTSVVLPLAELTRAWLGTQSSGLHGTIYGVILVATVLIAPRGIVGALSSFFHRKSEGEEVAVSDVDRDNKSPTMVNRKSASGSTPVLRAEGLHKSFGGLLATNDVSIELIKGEILGVIGPNGAGKTTLFNQLSGFITPDRGAVSVLSADGTWLKPTSAAAFARAGVGRTFQIAQPFSGLTVLENVMLGAFLSVDSVSKAREFALETLDLTGLLKQASKEARSLTVSGLKRLEIARALATRPRILLLDEVMAGLSPTDIQSAVELIKKVRDSGVSVLLIEHQMQATMALCDRIVVLDLGAVLTSGAPSQVVKDPRVIEAYLGKGFTHVEN